MAETKTVANGLFKPELWSKLILRNLDDESVMAECVNKDYEGEIKNQGDTVHIQQVGDITVNTHSNDTPITYQKLDGNSQTLVVDQQKEFGFEIPDIDQVQANVTLMDKYTKRAKIAVTQVKDAYLHTLGFAGIDADNQLGTVAIDKDNIYSTLVSLFEKLSDANAIDSKGKGEDGKSPWIVLPPAVISVVKLSPEAKNATTLGDETMRKGAIMNFAGFDIKQSTVVKNDSGYKILCGTKEGITYADQITKIKGSEDKDYFSTFVAGLYVYGAKVVQPACLAGGTFTIA